jgi:hypothetical protein
MDDSLKQQEMAEEAGIDAEKIDFSLNEEELKDVSGGSPANCGEIGISGMICTGTGV